MSTMLYRSRASRGFTLVELMIVVAITGILAAIAIPQFASYMKKAKSSEAPLQLNALGKTAKAYFDTNGRYPQGTAAVLPGPDGDGCKYPDHHFPTASGAWPTDSVWTDLDFHVDDPAFYSYHWASSSLTDVDASAVGDIDCDKTFATYTLTLSVANGIPAATIQPPKTED